jgi:hypothetical protein
MNIYIYWLGTGKISNFLNSLVHEVLGCAKIIILMIFFCKVKIFLLLDELPPKNYSILDNRVKISEVN